MARLFCRFPAWQRLECMLMLLALTSLAALQTALAACAVRLELDELASTLNLTNSNALVLDSGASLAGPASYNASVPRGFAGALYAVAVGLPSCPSPSNRSAWLENWRSFNLTSRSSSSTYRQPIVVYPALHLGKVLSKYDYNLSDLQATFSLESFAPVAGQLGAFTSSLRTQLAGGQLISYSIITGTRTDALQNLTANASAVVVSLDVKNVNGSHVLVLEVPAVTLTYQAVGKVETRTSNWSSFANHTLTGRLKATALLDCPSYCGDFGRCEVVNGTAQCVCDCGWAADDAGRCNLPWGYCDARGGVVAQQQASPETAAACNSPAPPATVAPVNGSCPAGYDWDSSGARCGACPSGFIGNGCLFCSSDDACQAKLGSSTGKCSSSPLYQPRTAAKQYACDVKTPGVAEIIGTTINFNCSTTKPAWAVPSLTDMAVGAGITTSSSPVNSTPYCQLSFRMAGMARDSAVLCTGWACQFANGSSKAHCPLVQCACRGSCNSSNGGVDTRMLFENLNTDVSFACGAEAGQPASADGSGSSSCSIALSGLSFLPPISVGCRTSECIDPANGTVTVLEAAAAESRAAVAVNPIIAWVPSMVLFLVAVTIASATAAFVRLAGPGPVGPAADPPAAGPVAEGYEGPSAHALEGSGDRRLSGGGTGGSDGRLAASRNAQQGGSSQRNELMLPPPSPTPPAASPAVLPYVPLEQQEQPALRPSLPGQLAMPSPQSTPVLSSSAAGVRTGSELAASGDSAGAAGSGDSGDQAEGAAAKGPACIVSGAEALPGTVRVSTPGTGRPMVQLLSWHDLHLCTRPRRAALRPWREETAVTLLQGVSGKAACGELLGIMGPSGSGKTTLLSVLAGLIQSGRHWRLQGAVRLDGRQVAAPRHLAALVGHVPQHDALSRSLTVAESVAASAALRLSWGELRRGRSHVQTRVAAVLRELRIAQLADRVVWPGGGAPLSAAATLSGGERLRVAIALEVVSDPPMLLLDEPLSGLDSATAKATMAVLREVATAGDGGRVVVASLHQPSLALFAALDSVLLMAGGRVAAAGPPGGLAAVLAEAALPPPSPDVHIAEHLLDLVVSRPKQAALLCDWHSARGGAVQPPQVAVSPGEDSDYVEALVTQRSGGGGAGARLRRLWLELGVVAWRGGLDVLRNPAMLALHLLVTAALGLLVGAVFSDTDLNVSGAQNRVGAIFFAVMLLACFATSAVDSLYPERATVDRDMLRRSYGVLPYMLGKLALDALLLRLLPAWAFGLPFYWLMGLRRSAAAFLTFLGAFTTMSCLSGAACIALSSVFTSPGRTVLVLNLLLLTCALFSGFLANKDSIVAWLRWIVYLSPIRFCWEGLVINELKPLTLSFSSPDLPQGLPAVRGSLFLSLLGVDGGMLQTDLIVLGCMYATLTAAATAFAALRLAALRGSWS